jgi:KaiC/GvpD/RAD55 family RecA-like ATPase
MVKGQNTVKKSTNDPIKRISSGVPGIDKILDGGIPLNSNILVSGGPGTGKSIFCYQMLDIAIGEGFKCLFITTNDSPDEVIKRAKRLGMFEERKDKEKIEFIDCYSQRLGEKSGYASFSTSNLNSISLEIGNILGNFGSSGVVVFDSFSDIVVENGDETAIRFMQVLTAKLRERNCIGLFVIVDDMHEKKTVTSLESICDGIITLNIDNQTKRFISIKKMKVTGHPLGKFEFKIRTTGIFMDEIEGFFQ